MSLAEVFLIAIGLAMDAFAVSIGAGTSGRCADGRAAFRLSFHFGLFQFMMPILGWFIGSSVASLFAAVDHWVAFGLLALVGGRMIWSGLHHEREWRAKDPSRGTTLVMLSIATSIDAFAVGLSMAMLQVSILYPSVVIGLVAAGFSLAGFHLGGRLGVAFGKRAEVAGGILLILIGLRIVVAHTTGQL